MGLTEPALYDGDEDARAHCSLGDPRRAHATAARARLDAARLSAAPFVPFADGFPTPSGQARVLLRSARRDDGPRPAARLHAAGRGGAGDGHPLALIAPASPLVPELDVRQQARPDGARPAARAIELHPEDAARARAARRRPGPRLQRPRRASRARSRCRDRVRPGVVARTKGHWLKHVRGGANVNATVDERDADMGGGAVFHDNRVEVEPVRRVRNGGQVRGSVRAAAASSPGCGYVSFI